MSRASNRTLHGVALWLAYAATAAAEPLTLFDIATATPRQVARLKSVAGDAWTLEMGDRLVVVGTPPAGVEGAARLGRPVEVDPDTLLLRARGCSEHAPEAGRVMAEGGRWELRAVAAKQVDALLAHPSGGWRAVPRDGAIARRFRSTAKRAAPDPRVQAVVDRLDAERWFADVASLAAFDRSSYGTASLEAARDFIASRFAGLGLAVESMPFQMPGIGGGSITRHNVIGTWTGTAQPGEWVVVGGHYDSRNAVATATLATPGAEDNATGCAGVIELARMLVASAPTRSIAFLCYAGEEQGLYGSQSHVARLFADGVDDNVHLVATLDMIGYSSDGDLEALFESSESQATLLQRFGEAAATYAPELDVVTSTFPFGSDHVPYLDAGLPAALSIENDWSIYPHYHRSTDTAANVGPHALAMGAAILKTNAALIAQSVGLPFEGFGDGFE